MSNAGILFVLCMFIGGLWGGVVAVMRWRQRHIMPDMLDFAMGAIYGALSACALFAMFVLVLRFAGVPVNV